MKNNQNVISVIKAGEMLGLSKMTAYKMVKEGKIPALRLGYSWRIPIKAIEKMLETGKLPDEPNNYKAVNAELNDFEVK